MKKKLLLAFAAGYAAGALSPSIAEWVERL